MIARRKSAHATESSGGGGSPAGRIARWSKPLSSNSASFSAQTTNMILSAARSPVGSNLPTHVTRSLRFRRRGAVGAVVARSDSAAAVASAAAER